MWCSISYQRRYLISISECDVAPHIKGDKYLISISECGVALLIKGDKYLVSISGCCVALLIKGDKHLALYFLNVVVLHNIYNSCYCNLLPLAGEGYPLLPA